MRDEKKWRLGVSMIRGLEQHVPASIDEACVEHYHSIVSTLEQASGEDLSHFRIPPNRLRPRVVGASRGSFRGGPGHVNYSKDKYCDDDYFRSQLIGLLSYLPSLERGSAEANSYESLTDFELEDLLINLRIPGRRIVKGSGRVFDREHAVAALLKHDRPEPVAGNTTVIHAYDSNVINDSPGASITQNIDYKSEDFRALVGRLKELSLSLSESIRPQMTAYTDTVELQINSPHPNNTIIQESLRSIRFILETAVGTVAGSLATTGILALLAHYIR